MEWNSFGDVIENIFTLAGGAAGIFAVIVGGAQLCGKKWIDYWFEKRNKKYQKEIDKDIEKYKSELKAKNDEIQNIVNTKLELLKIEYGVLYTKRLDVIKDMHERLLIFHDFESIKKDKTTIDVFLVYFNHNKIFLPKTLADIIFQYVSMQYIETINKNLPSEEIIADKLKKGLVNQDDVDVLHNCCAKNRLKIDLYNKLNINLQDILSLIEDEFRYLIGADIKRQ